MGLMDEIRRLTHPYAEPEDDYDDYDDEPLDDEEETPVDPPRRNPFSRTGAGATATATEPPRTATPGRVVNIASGQYEVIWESPKIFECASTLADHLLNRKAIVLNLEETDQGVARRLVDILYGCAYALGGTVEKVAKRTYFVTPGNVSLVKGNADETAADGANKDFYF